MHATIVESKDVHLILIITLADMSVVKCRHDNSEFDI